MRLNKIHFTKREWDKHIIRSHMVNRTGTATQLYNTLTDNGTITCARGTYNDMRSEMKKDV